MHERGVTSLADHDHTIRAIARCSPQVLPVNSNRICRPTDRLLAPHLMADSLQFLHDILPDGCRHNDRVRAFGMETRRTHSLFRRQIKLEKPKRKLSRHVYDLRAARHPERDEWLAV